MNVVAFFASVESERRFPVTVFCCENQPVIHSSPRLVKFGHRLIELHVSARGQSEFIGENFFHSLQHHVARTFGAEPDHGRRR
jgi:hypothetical protein